MAANSARYSGTDTGYAPSGTIWGNCPFNSIREGVVEGVAFEDTFTSFNKTPATTEGNWGANSSYAQFSSTSATLTAPALSAATSTGAPSNGVILTTGGSDNDAVSLRTLSTPFALNRATYRLWFEARVKKASIANTIAEMYLGFLENVTLTAIIPITTVAATLSDNNLCGFYSTETTGAKATTTYKANGVTAVSVGTDEATFVADTYTKLGMKLFKTGDKNGSFYLSFYQDGVRLTSTKQIPSANGTDFPNDVSMGLVFAIRAAAAPAANCTLQWWRAAQLYTPGF